MFPISGALPGKGADWRIPSLQQTGGQWFPRLQSENKSFLALALDHRPEV